MTNSQLTLVVILHVILYATVLFTMLYAMGDRLNMEHPFSIDEKGRFAIFFGVTAVGCIVILCRAEVIARIVGEKLLPYVFTGAMIIWIVVGMILYNYVPKRWHIPLGIAGWITSFSLAFWYFWFGPGANPPPL